VLLAAAGSTVGSWAYKGGGWRVLHNFKAAITCMQQSATESRVRSGQMRVKPGAEVEEQQQLHV
jgi:hypothetical protein